MAREGVVHGIGVDRLQRVWSCRYLRLEDFARSSLPLRSGYFFAARPLLGGQIRCFHRAMYDRRPAQPSFAESAFSSSSRPARRLLASHRRNSAPPSSSSASPPSEERSRRARARGRVWLIEKSSPGSPPRGGGGGWKRVGVNAASQLTRLGPKTSDAGEQTSFERSPERSASSRTGGSGRSPAWSVGEREIGSSSRVRDN